ncbi:MAG: DUF89 family protein [Deltaproteobacteria bacterium]|uniref:DUF89 family protein n=1 Tax=Candidatus Zymogenus saltonus TaxID=2844893 RepID=A0A9D8KG04_9DELT|nr:DUF89 family protein [Candidatus Zymogenus saltonus]
MLLKPECKSCILKQAKTAAGLSGAGNEDIAKIVEEASITIETAPPGITAPELAAVIYRRIREFTGVSDPYIEIKRKSLESAMSIYPLIEERVMASKDRLKAALVATAVGNIIDFGIPDISFSPQTILEEFENLTFAIDDYEKLRDELFKAKKILFLADNAGEIVLDRLFLWWARENLEGRVIFAVRGGAVINDATREDAIASGIGELAEIIDTGADIPGADLKTASGEFRKIFEESDLIVSKGQGNFEVLEGEDKNIFFILKAKCDAVAEHLSVKKGSLILLKN